MSLTWINAAALAGLALVALPVAIHLLVRQQTRVLPYPSLRFLRETALVAFRRRAIQDAALLVCRVAVMAAAVAALAGPVLHTPSRTAGYANRLSQAVIRLDANGPPPTPEDVFRSAAFSRAAIADAIGEAVRWLDAQPPSAREIVFRGSFRRGSLNESDLAAVPREVGIRFAADTPSPASSEVTAALLTRRNGTLVRIEQRVQVTTDATGVEEGAGVAVPEDRLRVVAAQADQSLAEAALAAALAEGVPWTVGDRRVLIVWDGADVTRIPSSGIDIIRMPVPETPASAARATWDAIDRATPRAFVDPVAIPREQLQSWSRPPGSPSPDAPPADEGDRRWLWAAALALLALEQLLRRERAVAQSAGSAPAEVRVA
jgi:hypothetical protein